MNDEDLPNLSWRDARRQARQSSFDHAWVISSDTLGKFHVVHSDDIAKKPYGIIRDEFHAAPVEPQVDTTTVVDKLVGALQMAKHIVMAHGTQEQLDEIFEALESAGVQP